MNADDNTRLFDSEETTGKNRKKSNDNAKTYGAAAGAAAVGAAAGVGAHAAYSATSEVEIDEDMDLEGAELAEGAGAAAHTQSDAEPRNSAPAPAPTPTPAPAPAPTPDTDHTGADNGDSMQPIPGDQNPGNPTPDNVEPGTSEPVEPVTPDEVLEDPEVAVDEILDGEYVDPGDIDSPEMVNFDSIGTVYTVDGEEFTAASFHMDNGFEGVMIDVDGDGVFDDIAAQTSDGLAKVGDAPGFTVDDVELELNPDDSYLAQNDDIDHTLADDSFADDIIDASMA